MKLINRYGEVLYIIRELADEEKDFHPRCAMKIFWEKNCSIITILKREYCEFSRAGNMFKYNYNWSTSEIIS